MHPPFLAHTPQGDGNFIGAFTFFKSALNAAFLAHTPQGDGNAMIMSLKISKVRSFPSPYPARGRKLFAKPIGNTLCP